MAAVDTNNGTEAQNKVLKYKYMPKRRASTLSAMVSLFWLRGFYQKLNRAMYWQTWRLLNGIDGTMILYHTSCEEDTNQSSFTALTGSHEAISTMTKIWWMERAFIIQRKDRAQYMVDFGRNSQEQMPSCSCKDWTRWHIPCKHFLAVFRLRQA